MLIPVVNDIYGIYGRLKEIDSHYYIVYNTKRNKYEVHHSAQRGGSYCLTIPYDEIDARTVTYVLKTRRQNFRSDKTL